MYWFLTLLGSTALVASTSKLAANPGVRHTHEAVHAPTAQTITVPAQQTVWNLTDLEPHETREASPFYWAASGFVAGVTGLLYLQHGRRRHDRTGAKQGFPALRLVPTGNLTAEDSPAAAGAGPRVMDTLAPDVTDPSLRRSGVRPVPFSMKTYFMMQPREQILWTAPYTVLGRANGMIALTNKRVLAVHHRRRIKTKPFRVMTETTQDDLLVTSLTKAEVIRTHRTWMLLIPALTLWFHPLGVLIGAAALGIYSTWPRRQLALYVGSKRYLYPLPDLDQREMLHLLNQPLPQQQQAAA